MAGDWIKMRADLFTHPKIVRMASALKADTLRTVGGLMSVWCLFDKHSTDGTLEGYTFDIIDTQISWPGFSGAMMTVNWISETAGGLILPEFETHNGASAKRRAQDAQRKQDVRKMSASETDILKTREEKRREEIKPTPTEYVAACAPTPINTIPHEKIRELYNEILGDKLSRCMGLTEKHRKGIKACYNLKLDGSFPVRDGGLEFWEGLFNDVLDCPFMLGMNNRSWKADFAFLTTATKLQSFMEGKYDHAA
jgi:hypothetical protein